jgi:hypothetical protein
LVTQKYAPIPFFENFITKYGNVFRTSSYGNSSFGKIESILKSAKMPADRLEPKPPAV